MPNNKRKNGKNNKRRTKPQDPASRVLTVKEEGQEYAQILKMLGGSRLEVYCFDGQRRMAVIRGTMRNRQWMRCRDIILVGLREYEEKKCDVLETYSQEEVRQLIKMRHIPDTYGHLPGEGDPDEMAGAAEEAGIEFVAADDSDGEGGDDQRVSFASAQPGMMMKVTPIGCRNDVKVAARVVDKDRGAITVRFVGPRPGGLPHEQRLPKAYWDVEACPGQLEVPLDFEEDSDEDGSLTHDDDDGGNAAAPSADEEPPDPGKYVYMHKEYEKGKAGGIDIDDI